MAGLNEVVKRFRVFVDTSTLMHEKAGTFFLQDMAVALRRADAALVIPWKVCEEVNRHVASGNGKQGKARAAASIIGAFRRKNLAVVFGEPADPFADDLFQSVFLRFRTRHDLALLTQDAALAREIEKLNHSTTTRTDGMIRAFRLTENGRFAPWPRPGLKAAPALRAGRNGRGGTPARNGKAGPSSPHVDIPPLRYRLGNRFDRVDIPRSGGDRLLNLASPVSTGDRVDAGPLGRARLGKMLGKGGEGEVYDFGEDLVAKVYFPEKLTEGRVRKIRLMAGNPLEIPGVCWPLAVLKNGHGQPVGYVMPRAGGKNLWKAVFGKPHLRDNFPGWDRRNLARLAVAILDRIAALHAHGVLLGDINPHNITVAPDGEVHFVDTDSYQVEGFPCPVGMNPFVAPEILGRDFSTFLRGDDHERFAVATLLFMILLPGKAPYSHRDGTTAAENVREGHFPYPCGERGASKMPRGPWGLAWSHLPFKTKSAFHACFTQGQRPSAARWSSLMRNYHASLEKGLLDPDVDESRKLFPSRRKQLSEYAKKVYGTGDGSGSREKT